LSRVVHIAFTRSCGFPASYVQEICGLETDASQHDVGHGRHNDVNANGQMINFNAELTVRLMDHLAQFQEGDRTVLDKTLILFINNNGHQHHSKLARHPFALLGNPSGNLKADGRYVRFSPVVGEELMGNKDHAVNAPATHSLSEAFNTICHALGQPKDDFAKEGREPSNGPLAELMV